MSGSPSARLLLADDHPDVLKALKLLFKADGYQVETAASPAAALAALQEREFDVVLIDLNYTRDTTSGREGLGLLLEIQAIDPAPAVIVMTAWGTIELAVEAMRRGARDFIEKPWDNERVRSIVRAQVELGQAQRRGRRMEAELQVFRAAGQPAEFIAESRVMKPVLDLILRVARADVNVLITGENGTGKGVAARLLHCNSDRSAKPFVHVDVGSLAENVFESEMFGHVKGAFTDARSDRLGRMELADGGTLFLDEIANVPPRFQAKLLRAVDTGEFEPVGSSRGRRADVRVVSATNADLAAEVAGGSFRRDLFFRLNAVEVRLPPLRDRREDVPLLAHHFLSCYSRRYHRPICRFSVESSRLLLEYPWPGNVRELDHAVQRGVLMAQSETIQPADLALQPSRLGPDQPRIEDMTLEEVERVLIKKALERHGGNISHAAAALGLSRTALYRRLEKHDLPRSEGPA